MTSTVAYIIAVAVVAIVACILALRGVRVPSTDGDNSDQTPSTDEGEKVCVVRGTVWVQSTQITAYLNPRKEK